MKLIRIAAVLAVPAALSLAACGGGSTATIANISGNTAQMRVVNGNPRAGSLDVYFQSTGAAPPSSPIVSGVSYGVVSDFLTQAAVAGSVIAMPAGSPAPSTGAHPAASCPVPQFAINGKYSIVFVNFGGAINCELFQDFDYTGAPQYRAHNAALNSALSGGSGFGTIPTPSAPPGSTFSVQFAGPQGNLAIGNGSPTTFTQAPPQSIPAFSGSISFAVGTASSGTGTALATLDSRYIFAAGGLTQPNSTGGLNFTGSVGTSIFAIDCTTAPAPNVACTNGIALIGEADRL
jgi:hypothetical protein